MDYRLIPQGSIILFSGNGFFSNAIKVGQFFHTKWKFAQVSHVGMFMRHGTKFCILESTSQNKTPDIFGKHISGPQICDFVARVSGYNGKIWVREYKGDPKIKTSLKAIYRDVKGKHYERSAKELINAAIDIPGFTNKKDESSIFCSEMNAMVLKHAGLIGGSKPCNEYTPADMAKILPDLFGKPVRVK